MQIFLSPASIALCMFYVIASVAEHLILESANQKISSQWSIFSLKGINSETEPEITTAGDDEKGLTDPEKASEKNN